jgi:hypothetical protein
MKMFKRFRYLVLAVVFACFSATGVFAQDQAPLRTKVGIIREVNLAESSLVVSGMRYEVAFDANVEIRGSYGAFSMLTTGMQIQFTYQVNSESERTIIEIEQIPDNFSIEQV